MMNVITKINPKQAISFEDVIVNDGSAHKIKMTHIRKLASSGLFGDAKSIVISHLGEMYMLSITKQNKLLLTKVKQEVTI